jgi:hypothetical protein
MTGDSLYETIHSGPLIILTQTCNTHVNKSKSCFKIDEGKYESKGFQVHRLHAEMLLSESPNDSCHVWNVSGLRHNHCPGLFKKGGDFRRQKWAA